MCDLGGAVVVVVVVVVAVVVVVGVGAVVVVVVVVASWGPEARSKGLGASLKSFWEPSGNP